MKRELGGLRHFNKQNCDYVSFMHRSMFLTSWSSMLLEHRMSVAQPLGWSCREVMQFPLSLSPGISGVNTSRLFLGERPASTVFHNIKDKTSGVSG